MRVHREPTPNSRIRESILCSSLTFALDHNGLGIDHGSAHIDGTGGGRGEADTRRGHCAQPAAASHPVESGHGRGFREGQVSTVCFLFASQGERRSARVRVPPAPHAKGNSTGLVRKKDESRATHLRAEDIAIVLARCLKGYRGGGWCFATSLRHGSKGRVHARHAP